MIHFNTAKHSFLEMMRNKAWKHPVINHRSIVKNVGLLLITHLINKWAHPWYLNIDIRRTHELKQT